MAQTLVQIGLNWPVELLQRVDAQAQMEDITRSEFVRRALRHELGACQNLSADKRETS